MAFLFDSFESWRKYCADHKMSLAAVVLEYERVQKNRSAEETWKGLERAWEVMREAVQTGLSEDMTSRSGMISNGAKKVFNHPVAVLSKEFQNLVARVLAAKELNACMGRVVAAPTAGASGIIPGVLYTLRELHQVSDEKIVNAMLISC